MAVLSFLKRILGIGSDSKKYMSKDEFSRFMSEQPGSAGSADEGTQMSQSAFDDFMNDQPGSSGSSASAASGGILSTITGASIGLPLVGSVPIVALALAAYGVYRYA